MRIALVDTNKEARNYPVSLLKIGAWQKSLGNECRLYNNRLPKKDEFDEIWLTTLFSFHISYALGLVREAKSRANKVRVGGISATLFPESFEKIGVEVHRGLIPEVEKFSPDYSLLDYTPEYSITHITRGCIRKCEFCMVRKLEPKYYRRDDWINDINPESKHIIFYDNNWLAQSKKKLKEDVDNIKALYRQKKIKTVDFNQALDCRLMTKEKADIIKGTPIYPFRFAFDGMHEDGYYQNATELMVRRGYTYFISLVLYNFEDTPRDFYYRIREITKLADKYQVCIRSFPMPYRPIDIKDSNRQYIGVNWTKKEVDGVRVILSNLSIYGTSSFSTQTLKSTFKSAIDEFEYWFGKDEDEFIKLLNYPNLKLLCKRKKGYVRIQRSKSEKV